MKIIFLDIDGVLNRHEHSYLKEGLRIHPEPAGYFQNLVSRSKAKVVLISSWRRWINNGHMTTHGFSRVLWTHGIEATIVDALPAKDEDKNHTEDRREKIIEWLEGHAVDSYVILDDLDVRLDNHIRPNMHVGLTPHHVGQALKILNA